MCRTGKQGKTLGKKKEDEQVRKQPEVVSKPSQDGEHKDGLPDSSQGIGNEQAVGHDRVGLPQDSKVQSEEWWEVEVINATNK